MLSFSAPIRRPIVIDIESYGAVERNAAGEPLPEQTLFHPRRQLLQDKVPLKDLLQTLTITLPRPAPRISGWTPGNTFILNLWNTTHVSLACRWIAWADCIGGFNLLYDLLGLRAHPIIRRTLNGTHRLLDGQLLKFLANESTAGNSLKDYGAENQLYSYAHTLKEGRFPSPLDPKFQDYACDDTHNTTLQIAHAASTIARDFPDSDKLSPGALDYFSTEWWTLIRLAESGIAMSVPALQALEAHNIAAVSKIDESLPFPMSGKGAGKGRQRYMAAAFHAANSIWLKKHGQPLFDVRINRSPLIDFTPAKAELACSGVNRNLVYNILKDVSIKHTVPVPNSDPIILDTQDVATTMKRWGEREYLNGIVSRYTYPLLRHRRKPSSTSKSQTESILLPGPPGTPRDIKITYPIWFGVPGSVKDDADFSGGQKQARPGARGPAAQQFPPPIKECVRSRHRGGFLLANDLSQIELRVPTLISGEPALMACYAPPPGTPEVDVHVMAAITMYGPAITSNPYFGKGDMLTDPRQWGKRGNFARLYRSSEHTIISSLLSDSNVLLDFDAVHRFVTATPRDWPVLWAWQEETIARAKREQHLVLPITGHSRNFIPSSKYIDSEAVNFPVQAPAAIALCSILNHLHRTLPALNHPNPPIRPIINWYDAIIFDCASQQAVDDCRGLWADAVAHVSTNGYWGALQSLYGRTVPLKYSSKILHPEPPHDGRKDERDG